MKIIFFLLLFSANCFAQVRSDSSSYFCGFSVNIPSSVIQNVQISDTAIQDDNLDSLINIFYYNIWRDYLNGRPNSIILAKDDNQAADYKFAAAGRKLTDNGSSKRYLYYRKKDLKELILMDNGWVLKTILLHELGHHINSDPFEMTAIGTAETYADDFAGFHLARLKVPLESALIAFSRFTDSLPINGYPSRAERIETVKNAWARGNEPIENSLVYALASTQFITRGFFLNKRHIYAARVENAVEKNIFDNPEIINNDSINMIVDTNSELSFEFLIDNNLLYYKKDDKLINVGIVKESNREDYEYMIVDKYYNYIYIDKDGRLKILKIKNHHRNFENIEIGYLIK